MQVERLTRLSRRLLSQLEEFYVHDPSKGEYGFESDLPEDQEKVRARELKVIKSEKTKAKLEKWFRERGIPIRIVYVSHFVVGESGRQVPAVSPIGKPGVITYCYVSVGQDPPTAWIVVHNLSHAVFEKGVSLFSPHELTPAEREDLGKQTTPPGWQEALNPKSIPGVSVEMNPEYWSIRYNLMGLNPDKPAVYPTTRSQQTGKIVDQDWKEAFHELFAQWVVTGKVILNPRKPKVEKELEDNFRKRIDYLAKRGAVVYNQ
jgi:hypothetical protein